MFGFLFNLNSILPHHHHDDSDALSFEKSGDKKHINTSPRQQPNLLVPSSEARPGTYSTAQRIHEARSGVMTGPNLPALNGKNASFG